MTNLDYKDDKICLMQGDCLERMKEIPNGSVLLLIINLGGIYELQ